MELYYKADEAEGRKCAETDKEMSFPRMWMCFGGGVQASSPVLWNVAVSKWGLKSESDEGMQRNKGWMLWKEPMYVKVQSEEEECHDGISGGQG